MTNLYDQILYPAGVFAFTHPRRLSGLARLFGLSPAPVDSCRVLELGCGNGSNLLPMAEALPGSTFLGLDLASRPIEEGEALRARLGLNNLTLRCQDVLDFQPEPSSYDYIIAHGLYAWVPPAVQERILAIFETALSPHGVAYVSYNALPGAYLRRPLRDIMRFHAGRTEDPPLLLAKARAIAGFVADHSPETQGIYRQLMGWQRDRIGKLSDGYLFHDDLSSAWEPLYFHQLMERAQQHGLCYLAEAIYGEMQDHRFPKEVRQMLRQTDDILLYEQYLDFLVGRSFRRTLLVRKDAPIERRLSGSSARPFFFTATAVPLPGPGATPAAPGTAATRFRNSEGVEVGLPTPLGQTALLALCEHAPAALSFDELSAQVEQRLGSSRQVGALGEQQLGELLLTLYAGDMVLLHAHRPQIALPPGKQPRARSLTRLQAEAGPEVTDLWHENDRVVDELARRVLCLCDGTRDRTALTRALLGVGIGGIPFSPEELGARIEEALNGLARQALLEA